MPVGSTIVPEEYHGREQTYLKHLVLKEYLVDWAHKLGSTARSGERKLWFVDCFAGPWHARNPELQDTSFAIGLGALKSAQETWRASGYSIKLGGIFVEKDAKAFASLDAFVRENSDGVGVHTFNGEFGDHVAAINKLIGEDAAFLFVDPTGWVGAAMDFIKPLVSRPFRDVFVNVMFNFINRSKEHPEEVIKQQIADFFGGRSQLEGLTEEELMREYRHSLKDVCRLPYAADLPIPHPTHARTWFRLVVGGHDPAVLRVFRSAEHKVIGKLAGSVRSAAQQRKPSPGGQMGMFDIVDDPGPSVDRFFEKRKTSQLFAARRLIVEAGRSGSRWDACLYELMQEFSLTEADANHLAIELRREKALELVGLAHTRRKPDLGTILRTR